jgi:hypothetical protein
VKRAQICWESLLGADVVGKTYWIYPAIKDRSPRFVYTDDHHMSHEISITNAFGCTWLNNSCAYQGLLAENKPVFGVQICNDFKYVGELREGKPDGEGQMSYAGLTFKGRFKGGLFHGEDNEVSNSLSTLKWNFKDGWPYGQGALTHTNGGKCSGAVQDDGLFDLNCNMPDDDNGNNEYSGKLSWPLGFVDKIHLTFAKDSKYKEFKGKVYCLQPEEGKMTYKNGGHYEGQFSNNKPDGVGQARLIFPGDSEYAEFTGKTFDGKPWEGKMTYKNGGHYEGQFSNNKPDGVGQACLIFPGDSEYAEFTGKTYDGKPWEGKMTYKDGRKVQFVSGNPK